MAAAIGLRADYGADDLRRLARSSRDAAQTRRLLALSVIHDGGSRTEAARVGGVTLQIVRDWVLRFNAEGPSGLIDRRAPGKAPLLQAEHRAALAAAGDGLCQLSARPRHYAQDPEAADRFKKAFPNAIAAIRARLPAGTPVELWFQCMILGSPATIRLPTVRGRNRISWSLETRTWLHRSASPSTRCAVDSTAKRNGSSEADFDVPAKL
jgi:Winged helix-turn helix